LEGHSQLGSLNRCVLDSVESFSFLQTYFTPKSFLDDFCSFPANIGPNAGRKQKPGTGQGSYGSGKETLRFRGSEPVRLEVVSRINVGQS